MTEESIPQTKYYQRRRELLPWWIKTFSWLFLLTGVLSLISLLLGFTHFKPDLAIYGFESNEPFSLFGLMVISIGLLKGYTAYSLLFGKDYAILIGKVDAIIGIILTSITMIALPFLQDGFRVTFRFELLLLIPFLIKLKGIEKDWNLLVV